MFKVFEKFQVLGSFGVFLLVFCFSFLFFQSRKGCFPLSARFLQDFCLKCSVIRQMNTFLLRWRGVTGHSA